MSPMTRAGLLSGLLVIGSVCPDAAQAQFTGDPFGESWSPYPRYREALMGLGPGRFRHSHLRGHLHHGPPRMIRGRIGSGVVPHSVYPAHRIGPPAVLAMPQPGGLVPAHPLNSSRQFATDLSSPPTSTLSGHRQRFGTNTSSVSEWPGERPSDRTVLAPKPQERKRSGHPSSVASRSSSRPGPDMSSRTETRDEPHESVQAPSAAAVWQTMNLPAWRGQRY